MIFLMVKKNRENVVVLHILLFDNFNFPRKIGVICVNARHNSNRLGDF